ncbi:STAS domain-containing protein [Bradyrhizobium sp. 2TAF24]|uniref:STAS domain-containing protein n=1 Tax=Bradyrhizobium sp. 2TAF24 TaxID=3233011 RepID=UPI003F8E9DF2
MDKQSGSHSVRLPADCSIGAIRSTYEMVREASGRQQQLDIDCSAVEKADVTAVQLLLSLTKTAEQQGRRIGLRAFSQALRNALHRAGFATGSRPYNSPPATNGS